MFGREDRLPEASHRERRDARRSRKRIGRRAIRVATAKRRTPRPSATLHREMSAGNATPWRFHAHVAIERVHAATGETGFLKRAIASDATRGAARKRIGRRGIRVATAKPRTPRPSATPRRKMRFPRRRAGSRKEACFTGGMWLIDSLSAKRSLRGKRAHWRVFIAFSLR